MEPRRLRLYVVAYLRGLLKPYYDQGVRSQIREELVLKALSDELDSQSISDSLFVDSTFWHDGNNRAGIYGDMYDKIEQIRHLKEFAPGALGKTKRANDIDNLLKLYMILKDSGVLNKLSKKIVKDRKTTFSKKYDFGIKK